MYQEKNRGNIIKIEDVNPNYIYLIHNTSLTDENIIDVYNRGLAYSSNDIIRVFNIVEENSIEQTIIDKCDSYQCFLYKIPLSFFKPTENGFYPIPIWYYDKSYKPKYNISSSRVKYDPNEKKPKYCRVYPTLLLGHYDIRTNSFYHNPNYLDIISNSNGVYDRKQLQYLDSNLINHNSFILGGHNSPYKDLIEEIINGYQNRRAKK